MILKKILLVGLGNITPDLQLTRHNAGSLVLQKIYDKYKFTNKIIVYKNNEVHFLFNPAPINDSGPAIKKYMIKYNIPIENLIIFHDDLEIPLGQWKIKTAIGASGHNGLRSINNTFKYNNNSLQVPTKFRIGIGRPINAKVSDYVLETFTNEEFILLFQTVESIMQYLDFSIFF